MTRYQRILASLLFLWAVVMPVFSQTFTMTEIPDSVWQRMQGRSYPKECAIERSSLRYLRLSHYDAQGAVHVGELVCNRTIAADLISIFRELYDAHYPIESMRLIDDFDADDERSMTANNTSCFCYRPMTGGKSISRHGYGLAIDINPLYNPYVKGTTVQPAAGRKYAAARKKHSGTPMIIDRNDLCYRLFMKHGFTWGGAWKSLKDYQHFEK